MSELTITDQPQNSEQGTRTFYRSDYRHMARILRDMRHVRGDRYTGKSQDAQDKVAALALTIGQAFEEDAAGSCQGCGFDFGKFMAGTQLPEKPVYPQADDDEADDSEPTQEQSMTAENDWL